MRVAGLLLVVAGAVQILLGLAGLTGTGGIEANVEEIQSNPDFGRLYLPLWVWSVALLLFGLAEVLVGAFAWRGTARAWLAGLLVAFLGLGLSFFSFAIFRFGALATAILLMAAAFLLAYRSRRSP
jgi:hypothetical protein